MLSIKVMTSQTLTGPWSPTAGFGRQGCSWVCVSYSKTNLNKLNTISSCLNYCLQTYPDSWSGDLALCYVPCHCATPSFLYKDLQFYNCFLQVSPSNYHTGYQNVLPSNCLHISHSRNFCSC